MHLFLLILTVFLVRVHLFLLFFTIVSDFKSVKKVCPYEEHALFFTNFDCFPRKGTLHSFFYYFSDFKSVKKVYPYEENSHN